MLSEPQLFEKVMFDIKRLSPEKRLLIIKLTSETLLETTKQPNINSNSTLLPYGKYRGEKTTSLEDFKIAQWQPTDEYLNSF
jgi:hypothetical protein